MGLQGTEAKLACAVVHFPSSLPSSLADWLTQTAGCAAGDKRLASGKSALKNRLAQQRYRQKQKERMHEAEREIAALQTRLGELELKAQALDERNRFLEAATAVMPANEPAQEVGACLLGCWPAPCPSMVRPEGSRPAAGAGGGAGQQAAVAEPRHAGCARPAAQRHATRSRAPRDRG